MSDPISISLVSPASDSTIVFNLSDLKSQKSREENYVVVEVIRWVISEVEELKKNDNLSDALKKVDYNSALNIANLSTVYNHEIELVKKSWINKSHVPEFIGKRAPIQMLKFITSQCYNRSVNDPDKLNQYPPFSAQVYGETSFELVLEIVREVKIRPTDTFIDLGSGVGQVVIQIAGLTEAKFCFGIEKAEYPSACAARLDAEFRNWMAFFGKIFTPYQITKGDFLSKEIHERIINADVIFANNFAFGPEVDHLLKEKFQNLKEGSRIISSKAFCPLNFRISDRNLGDIGSILRVSSLSAIANAVSWTDKPFSYFIHVIDRKILEDFFYRSKNPKLKMDTITNRYSNSSKDSDVRGLKKSLLLRKKSHKIERKKRRSNAKINLRKTSSLSTFSDLKISPKKSTSSNSVINTPTNSCSPVMENFSCPVSVEAEENMSEQRPPRQTRPAIGQLKEKVLSQKAFSPKKKKPSDGHRRSEKRKSSQINEEDLEELHNRTNSSIDQLSESASEYNEPALVSPNSKYPKVKLNTVSSFMSHAKSTEGDLFNGHSNDCTPVALQQYLDLCRRMFMVHFKTMQKTEYVENLNREIYSETDRNKKLKAKVASFNDSIERMKEEGAQLLTKCSNKIGIKVDPPVQFFTEARKIIKSRASLEQKIDKIISEITELNVTNSRLKNEAIMKHAMMLNPALKNTINQASADSNTQNAPHRNPFITTDQSLPPELSPLKRASKHPAVTEPSQLDDRSRHNSNASELIPQPPELSLIVNDNYLANPPSDSSVRKSMHTSFQEIINEEITGSQMNKSTPENSKASPFSSDLSTTSCENKGPNECSSRLSLPLINDLKSDCFTESRDFPSPSSDQCLPPRKRHWESQMKHSATTAGST